MSTGPDTNGSQFFFVYRDSQLYPDYTQFGTVLSGMSILDEIAAAGVADVGGKPQSDGAPAKPLIIESLTLTA
jgi:peptidyl-prolyl cis-trans isomerase B (cyclophilin B)